MLKHRFWLKRFIGLALALILMFCSFSGVAQALSYQYNDKEDAVAAPDGYKPVLKVRSNDIESNLTWMPTDLFIDSANEVHLLDQQNGCVFVFDRQLKFLRKVLFYEDGEEAFLTNLNGLFVQREGDKITYYIADTDNKRVIFADGNGNIFREILKPDSAAFDAESTFSPTKVGLDSNGNLYVLVSGVYQGMCVFSKKDDYEFITFLGGNTVESNATVIADYFWKQIFNKTQIASMRRYVPVQCSNFFIDPKDNLYTVTNKSSSGTNFENEIKKFNASNVNIIKQQDWGDVELARDSQNLFVDTSYVDIAVGDDDIVAALDGNLCRVAVFTAQGDRLFTFGESNQINGSFDTPVAIDMLGQDIYVLDSHRQSITMFTPNEYGKLVLTAAKLHTQGKYDEAFPLWKQVLNKNGGNLLAYVGMGKHYLSEKKYELAMDYFRQGGDRESYSQAFGLQRNVKSQKFFPVIAVIVIAAFLALLILDARLKNKSRKFVEPNKLGITGKIRYTLFHPCEGGLTLARATPVKTAMTASLVILVAWFLASICKWRFSGFIFNTNLSVDFNVWLQLAKTFGLFVLWIVSGWLVSNLMDSSARFTDLIVVSATALIPYVSGLAVYTVLSNILSLEEGSYLLVIQVVALLWSFAILWGGMREVHEMSFKGSLLCMIFTVFGMALVIFMMILLWSLFQQVLSFASQIFIEIKKMIG